MSRTTSAEDTTTYSGRLGKSVRARREKLGISVSDFAASLKVKPVTIYAWESGKNPVPINIVPTIAKVLGTTAAKILPAE